MEEESLMGKRKRLSELFGESLDNGENLMSYCPKKHDKNLHKGVFGHIGDVVITIVQGIEIM